VGIVPKRWFTYHDDQDPTFPLGRATGVVFSMVPEVAFVLDNQPLVTAHELGHTYGFGEGYIPKTDGTCCDGLGKPAEGFWVDRELEVQPNTGPDKNKDIVGFAYDYMGSIPLNIVYPDQATERWSTDENFEKLFKQFLTQPTDPEILVVTGTITAGDTVTIEAMSRVAQGRVSQPPPGDTAVRAVDTGGTVVAEVPFTLDFRVFIDTARIVDTAPFGFAVPYPPTAAYVQVVHAGRVLVQVNITSKLLHDAVASIPDAGFREEPAEHRKELFNKIDALDKKLAKKDFNEARDILHDEIREELLEELINGYPTQSPLELSKDQLLSLVDELVQRLPQVQGKDH
jgi:hypothetical protein